VPIVGTTDSGDVPTLSYDDTYNGGTDMLLTEMDLQEQGAGNGGGAIPEYTTPIAIALAVGVSLLVIVLVRQRMVKKEKANIDTKEKK
jgi:hypothetical protein